MDNHIIKKVWVISSLILLLAFSSCKQGNISNTTEPFYHAQESQKENKFGFLFNQISDLQKANGIVGAEVLIIRNDTIQLHDVVGWSDREQQKKLQKNSIYRVRSLTKPFIATAILILLEEGKLALEDPVSKYIPSFDNLNSKTITIKQCLSHSSGLASHDFEEVGLSKKPFEFSTLREVVDEIGEIGLIYEPGKFHYSGSGVAILTELINILSGTSAEDFIKQRIFTPLGMHNSYTSFNPAVEWASKLNPTYEWSDSTNDFFQYWNPTLESEYKYFRGHGGIYTSAMDYAKFLSMWLNNGSFNNKQILSKKTINKAQSETVLHPLMAPHSHQSLAWRMLKPQTTSNSISYYMHGGSDGTMVFTYPKENTLALYFNQSRNHPRFIFENLMAITRPYDSYRKWNYNNSYLDEWKEILLRKEGDGNKVTIEPYEQYVGTYKCKTNDSFDSELILKDGDLIMKNLKSGYECTLRYYKENEFICRFRPPSDGFISKVKFKNTENDIKSFSLEWLNKKKFEFEKIK